MVELEVIGCCRAMHDMVLLLVLFSIPMNSCSQRAPVRMPQESSQRACAWQTNGRLLLRFGLSHTPFRGCGRPSLSRRCRVPNRLCMNRQTHMPLLWSFPAPMRLLRVLRLPTQRTRSQLRGELRIRSAGREK